MAVNQKALDRTASKLHVSLSDAHVIIATYLGLVGVDTVENEAPKRFAYHRGGGNYIVGEKLRGKANVTDQYGDGVTFEND